MCNHPDVWYSAPDKYAYCARAQTQGTHKYFGSGCNHRSIASKVRG
ncbi:MAG: hypothetical protein K6L60_06290 [Oceanobacter sp.]